MKTCKKCGITEDRAKFRKHRRVCLDCERTYGRESINRRRRENPEKYKAIQKKSYTIHREERTQKLREHYYKNRLKMRESSRQFGIDNRDHIAAQNKKHYQKNKEKVLAYNKMRRIRDREKVLAQKAIFNEIRVGRLVPPKICSVNDGTCHGRIEAHHPDYSKNLDVIWLCVRHHAILHRKIKSSADLLIYKNLSIPIPATSRNSAEHVVSNSK